MKQLFLALLLLSGPYIFAQNPGQRLLQNLPCITVSSGSSIHFRSPEPILYADISDPGIRGDLPVKNVLRIKIPVDSPSKAIKEALSGIVTIIGESFMAQYRLSSQASGSGAAITDIEILPSAMVPLDPQRQRISTAAIRGHAMDMLRSRGNVALRKTASMGISARLNQVFCIDQLIFLDLSFENHSQLSYDAELLRMSIEDKKINKATNHQSVEIRPVWSLYPLQRFNKSFRNIYVIDKLTFSADKLLELTMSEKQPSARTVSLKIKYGDLLGADTF